MATPSYIEVSVSSKRAEGKEKTQKRNQKAIQILTDFI